ncbi:AAA family ATPase [Thermohalobacter berrensis]|uniref:YhaN AAA domain-containing protein n=1 Tax=Thermohalobacter berrensis TaxID=99594 RepID=A0A419SZG0_9FIRM|nr:AAA family ATPase [Thermohalobacter berrensis]RKD30559.1 hypothetical protein BET03_04275 [Thermohalobacter berrensis]
MIIEELILSAFGKFKGKHLKLKDGLNVIYGNNEAGKTTIHKFIEGMFYGFFKPYTKRKLYTDDYHKYLPWDCNEYKGILKYRYKDSIYRIERNFMKRNDEVKIYDDKTGEDVTHMFEYDNVTRLHNPASLHLGLNSIVYNNTVSIKQLGNKTEESLAKEVKDSLINLGGSLDEDISIKRVLERLDKKIEDIGTENRIKTSPYGKLVNDLNKLYEKRDETRKIYDNIKIYQERLNIVSKELDSLLSKRDKVKDKVSLIDGLKTKKRYLEGKKLYDEIEKLKEEILKLEEYKNINGDDYTETLRLDDRIKELEKNLNEAKKEHNNLLDGLNDIEKEIEKLKYFEDIEDDEIDNVMSNFNILMEKEEKVKSIDEEIKKYKEELDKTNCKKEFNNIEKDFYEHEAKEEERNKLIYSKNESKNILLESKLGEKKRSLKRLNIFVGVSGIGMILLSILGFLINPLILTANIIPLGTLLYSIVKSKTLKSDINSLVKQVEETKKRKYEIEQKVNKLEEEMKNILRKHGCLSKAELTRKFNEYNRNNNLQNNITIIKRLENQKKELGKEIENLKGFINKYLTLVGLKEEINLENIMQVRNMYKEYTKLKNRKTQIIEAKEKLSKSVEEINQKHLDTKEKYKEIISKNKSKNIQEFKEKLNKKNRYIEICQSLKNKEELLNRVLDNEDLETLEHRAKEFMDIDTKDIEELDEELDREFFINKLEELEREISRQKEEKTRLEEKIKNLTSNTEPLVDIEEEIIRKTKLKRDFERKIKALNIARDTINRISKEIQSDFAPKLNKKVGTIIEKITNGKYNEVKITDSIDIKAVNPHGANLIDIEKLSGGTIDQFYFATRFGIIDIIRGDNNLPLILDDCFVQYDNKRLYNILSFLIKESNKRQIILFTCHKREKEVLDKINTDYNFIEIG